MFGSFEKNEMKKFVLTVFIFAIICLDICGQSNAGLKYQAVIRNVNNLVLKNQTVGIKFKIQRDSIGGTLVYNETFVVTTNTYGLVNLKIGTGVTIDDFTTIDWGFGTYFLETSVDFSPSSQWSVMGISKLMSVPYALHSNTTDSVVSGINSIEIDPTFISSLANTFIATDTIQWNTRDTRLDSTGVSNLGFVAGPKTIDTDTQIDSTGISNLGFVAGLKTIDTNTQLDSIGISNYGYLAGAHSFFTDTKIDSIGISNHGYVAEKIYSIGMCPELGGYIFRLSSDGKHGLIAETQNQIYSVRWYTCDSVLNDPTLHSLDGKKFYDWRLPTKFELNEMFIHRLGIGGTLSTFFSSTEYDFGKVWIQLFGVNNTGYQTLQAKNSIATVRTIRSF